MDKIKQAVSGSAKSEPVFIKFRSRRSNVIALIFHGVSSARFKVMFGSVVLFLLCQVESEV